MYYFLVKKRKHDGSENKNPEKIRCTLSFGFDPVSGTEIARALINNYEIAILQNARLFAIDKAGLHFKGSEHKGDDIFYQEWLCAYDENYTEVTDDMSKTQSCLFEGM